MNKKGKPPIEDRKRILQSLDAARTNFVLDPRLVKFYHVKRAKGFKSMAVTVVETKSKTFVVTSTCRKHSSDYAYGPQAERILLHRLDSHIREEINDKQGLITEGKVKQYRISVPKESSESEILWDFTIDVAMRNIEQFPGPKKLLKDAPHEQFKVKPKSIAAERLPE